MEDVGETTDISKGFVDAGWSISVTVVHIKLHWAIAQMQLNFESKRKQIAISFAAAEITHRILKLYFLC